MHSSVVGAVGNKKAFDVCHILNSRCVGGSIPSAPTKTSKNMQLEISKTNFELMMSLIDKSVTIIQQKNPTTKEYNVARQLRQVKSKILRKIEKSNGKG